MSAGMRRAALTRGLPKLPPSIRATSYQIEAPNAASCTNTIPATAQVGDLAYFWAVQSASSTWSWSGPAGWTAVHDGSGDGTNFTRSKLWTKIIASGDPGNSAFISGASESSSVSTGMVVLSGALATLSPTYTHLLGTVNSTELKYPGITPPSSNCLLLGLGVSRSLGVNHTPPSGWTLRMDAGYNSGLTNGTWVSASTRVLTDSSPTSTASGSMTGAGRSGVWTIAVPPA